MDYTKLYDYRLKFFERPFRKLTLEDHDWVNQICLEDCGIGSHINFLTMMQCQEIYEFDSFRKYYGCILKRPWIEDGKLYCQYPIGAAANRKKAVQKIIKLYAHKAKEYVFFSVLDDTLKELQELYPSNISNVLNDLDTQEYVLDVKEQLSLEGSKFANKRKKIRRFSRMYNWTCEKITQETMQDCLDISNRWCTGYENRTAAERQEKALNVIFKNYSALDYRGSLFRIDGKPVAFCIGAPFNNEIFMNISMKADNEYRDSTIAFLYEFMRQNCADYQYANDSCDMGLPGLRSFKTNLHPKFMVPSYYVTVKL